ncbi:MAG TPA: glycoside hydrolase family 13 protein [Candidatus Limnocylindrales bacterium]|nr:glycoside hydrolase family 13 protein [Candidatus Limnocylindrales bacterium]
MVGGVSSGSLLEAAHHDGSPAYCPEPPKEHGDTFTVLLRTSAEDPVSRVAVRQVHDGEPVHVQARLDRRTPSGTWWRADLVAHNTVSHYRFLLDGGSFDYRWLTAAGPVEADVPDVGDFRVALASEPPSWLDDAIVYQVLPDRFARSGRVTEPLPDWAVPAAWEDAPERTGRPAARQFFGGDLYGVAEHLDHISSVGANTLYLTPVFPAPSSHRYNASSFDHVDPLLGGDAAYRELIDAAHARGMRVLGDLTTNHTGNTHGWFLAGRADPNAPESTFYHFIPGRTDGAERDYVGWSGHRTLPKLDHRSRELRRRLVDGPDSVVARWLRFGLDGWRIDVANMTGRYRDTDLTRAIAREIRATMAGVSPEAYLVGEHFHDFLGDVDGTTWHGIMDYSGLARPMWTWLARQEPGLDGWLGVSQQRWPHLPGPSVMSTMRAFSAIPWSARRSSLTLVSSHDTPRIATITGSAALTEVAIAAMLTHPGVPMIWAGDEIGMEGVTGEQGRRAFPWTRPESWDHAALSVFRQLCAVRRDSEALRRGGLRWAYVDADRIVWLRETEGESILVLLARAGGDPITLRAALLGLHEGAQARNVYGGATLTAGAGLAVLPGDGPMVQMWQLPGLRSPGR